MSQTMSSEHRLILTALRAEWSDAEQAEITQLTRGVLDWKEILGQAYAHRIAGLLYGNLISHGVYWLYKEGRIAMQATRAAHIATNKELLPVLEELARALRGAGIPYVFLKGPVMTNQVYQDLGVRISNDVDILIHPSFITATSKVLTELGYIQGTYDDSRKTVVPVQRGTAMLWRTYTHELSPFVKVLNGDFLERSMVDVNFSLELGQRTTDKVRVEELLERRIPIRLGAEEAYSLSWEDFVMHLCVHAAKEGTAAWAAKFMTDLTLYKFCDLHYAIRRLPVDWTQLLTRASTIGLDSELFWSIYHTEMLFPQTVEPAVLEAVQARVPDRAYLSQVTDGSTVLFHWDTPFLERLFDFGRFRLVPQELGEFSKMERAINTATARQQPGP